MPAITAQLVKELRERTGAGMMECKKALTQTDGDIEAAVEQMRKSGLAKADKKADRVAAEGTLAFSVCGCGSNVTLLELNCETDFVAMGDDFQEFAVKVAEIARKEKAQNLESLNALPFADGRTVEEQRRELIAKIGENITIRRFETFSAEKDSGKLIGHYLHGKKIGAMVEIKGGDAELAKDLAMQVAAGNPQALSMASLPADFVAKEKEIAAAKFADSGKPAEVIAKMVDGAVNKIFSEATLLGQKFIKNPDQSIENLLKSKNAEVIRYVRYERGEGIEKEESDFVAEVMAQAKG
ncbi:MAG: elongation factor Ts [Cardiobacteriaceae bacterium]|nr:elongation factor Ts [Cardiobacteriaceae bacterium]